MRPGQQFVATGPIGIAMDLRSRLLWMDCLGGLAAGVVVLVASPLLAQWHQLPLPTILFLGAANLVYGSGSLLLALQSRRPPSLIQALAIANMLWGAVCVLLVVAWWGSISWLGMVHLLGEGAYVALLGGLEWRWRKLLETA